jgi:hypothetical protein
MGRACSTNGKRGGVHIENWWDPEGKRPLGRPRRRWMVSIKMYLREIGWDSIDWIYLA